MALATSSSSMMDRMVRAARLDTNLYEEVEADTNATTQALTVVVIAAVAGGIGAAIAGAMGGTGTSVVGALIGGVLTALLGWVVWSGVMYFVGTRLFGGQATWGEVMRTVGFANSPGVLMIFSFIPFVGGLLALVVALWSLATGFVAVRQALDLDNGKTIATIIIGFIGYMVVAVVVGAILAAVGLGTGMMRVPAY